jgi:hypothetical protein
MKGEDVRGVTRRATSIRSVEARPQPNEIGVHMKKSLLRSSVALAVLFVGTLPTNVLAQGPSPSPSISARDLSDQKLKAVATALERVSSLQDEYQQRIAQTEAPAEKERIVAEGNKELTKAVTEQGLSVEEYSSILNAARDNPEVRDKLLQHVQGHSH